jgi:putative tricarboxylic transport membrane protein
VDAKNVDHMVVVAPLNSVYQDIPTLVDKMKNDASEAVWAGGPVGGASQAAVGQLAQALGVNPEEVIYKAFPNEAEAAAGIAGGQADIAMLPLSAVAERAEEGNVRILAIASETPLQGLAVPTLRDQGIDVVARAQ